MPKLIPLTQGQFAIVDEADYDWLMQWKWYFDDNGYAARDETVPINERADPNKFQQRHIKMHNLILPPRPGTEVDHRDRNRLNNQRSNLRIATRAQNIMNTPKRKPATSASQYKGVTLARHNKRNPPRWKAAICFNRTNRTLGYFANEADAARAYDAAARELFGEFAYLNFPESE